MKITKEMLEEKKQELEARREELLGQANAVNGALESVEYWLSMLEEPEPQPSSTTSPLKVVG